MSAAYAYATSWESEVAPLRTCQVGRCSIACTLQAGGYVSRVADCETCMSSRCTEAVRACATVLDCQKQMPTAEPLGFQTAGVFFTSGVFFPAPGKPSDASLPLTPEAERLFECGASECGDRCGGNAAYSCLDSVERPVTTVTPPELALTVYDFFHQVVPPPLALTGLPMTACAGLVSPCIGLEDRTTDDEGSASFRSVTWGTFGYFEATRDTGDAGAGDGVHALLQLEPAIPSNAAWWWPAPSDTYVSAISTFVGFDPIQDGTGMVTVLPRNCFGALGGGVDVTASTPGLTTYYSHSSPVPRIDTIGPTDRVQGTAAYLLRVPPGELIVTLSVGGRAYATRSALVRAGYDTVVTAFILEPAPP